MKFVSRLLRNPAKEKESPSTWGAKGFYNWWGGFHRIQDREAYFRLIHFIMRKPWDKNFWKIGLHYMWYRWIHRRCDTVDFHHSIYCTLDPWVRKRESELRYIEVWSGRWPTLTEEK